MFLQRSSSARQRGSRSERNKAQGRESPGGHRRVRSSVISFHHYLVTNIVWALNSTLIKTVYVMCKIYLGVGVPLWGSVTRWTISLRRGLTKRIIFEYTYATRSSHKRVSRSSVETSNLKVETVSKSEHLKLKKKKMMFFARLTAEVILKNF